MRRFSFLCAVALMAVAALSVQGHAESRIGLVIGNNDYPKLKTARDPGNGQLAKAVADAESMEDTLKSLGFDVVIGRNVDRVTFLTLLDRVKRKIAPGDTVFVFFAGHGVAFRGSNLLLPSDIPAVDPEGENLIRGLAIAETDIIDAVREKGAGLTILALDACRDNPIEQIAREEARVQGRSFRSVSMRSVGLNTAPTSGVFSIYSAGLGQKALDGLPTDGAERNSVFTRVFIRKVREPGRHLGDVMEDVKEEVAKLALTVIDPDTQRPHRQAPSYYNETLGGRVFLAGRPVAAPPDTKAAEIAALQEKLRGFEEQLRKRDELKPAEAQKADETKTAVLTPPQAAPAAPTGSAPSPAVEPAPAANGFSSPPAPVEDPVALYNDQSNAARGDADAMYRLGHRYTVGQGVPYDYVQARFWFEKAAYKGNDEAMNRLGRIYFNGEGVASDKAKAKRWFELAIARGNFGAASTMGVLFPSEARPTSEIPVVTTPRANLGAEPQVRTGPVRDLGAEPIPATPNTPKHGAPSDYFPEAATANRRAALDIDPERSLRQGSDKALAERPDHPATIAADKKAATAGDKDAMVRLRERYRCGYGVKRDAREAGRWAEKAMALGYKPPGWEICDVSRNDPNFLAKIGKR